MTGGIHQAGDCMGESWVDRVKGVAYQGASRIYATYTPSKIGRHIVDRYCDSIYVWGQIGQQNDPWVQIGDPGLTIWGDIPAAITCTYDGTMPVGANDFGILVKEGASPVKGATVCLMSTNDVYSVGETDGSGEIVLHPVPASDDTVYITVSSPFHIPHEGTIMVDHSSPFPGYKDRSLTEVTGNGNSDLNPGETWNIHVTLKNYGDVPANNVQAILRVDTLATVSDSTTSYGTIGPGGEVARAFTFRIPELCSDNSRLRFSMEVTDGTNTWEFPTSSEWPIVAPDIIGSANWRGQIYNFTIGGVAEPGSTLAITLFMKNVGSDYVSSAAAWLTSNDPYVTLLKDSASFGAISVGDSADNASNPFEFKTHPTTPGGHIATLGLCNPQTSGHINWRSTGAWTLRKDGDNIHYGIKIGSPPTPLTDTLFFDDFEHAGTFDPAKWDTGAIDTNWVITDVKARSGTWCARIDTLENGKYWIETIPYHDLLEHSSIVLDFWTITYGGWGFGSTYDMYDYESDTGWAGFGMMHAGSCCHDTFGHVSVPFNKEGFDSTRFRVGLSVLGQNNGAWYLDDFAILDQMSDFHPPSIREVTQWNDTLFTGPFPISAKITSDWRVGGAVAAETLYYRAGGNWIGLGMSTTGPDPNLYEAAIPIQVQGTTVDYYVWATDDAGVPNAVTDPVAAPTDGYYSFLVKGIGTEEKEIPGIYRLCQNCPNPCAGATTIRYALAGKSRVSLRIYDLSGRLVKTLVDKEQKPGFHGVKWNIKDDYGRKVSTGVYFYKLDAGDFKSTKKLVLF